MFINKKVKRLYLRVFLGAGILLLMGNSFASSDTRNTGDINVNATGNAKAIGHANHVTTDNLTQNQGGRGGDNHIIITTPFPGPSAHVPLEREKKAYEYFAQAESLTKVDPPNWEEALRIYTYAARAQTPHMQACVRCGEYYSSQNRVSEALDYYTRALSAEGVKDDAYRGLMRLHYNSGIEEEGEEDKESLEKAKRYAEKIELRSADDKGILRDIKKRLEKLGVPPKAEPFAESDIVSTVVDKTSAQNQLPPLVKAVLIEEPVNFYPVAKVEEQVRLPQLGVKKEIEADKELTELKRRLEASEARFHQEEQKRIETEKKAQEEQRLREEQLRKQLEEAEKKATEEQERRLLLEQQREQAAAREQQLMVSRPIPTGPAIPEIASGYEEIYLRFLNGKLVYRPNEGSDVGKIELPIAALANPLEGTFDLRSCGDAGNYLSISTGYRKGKNEANRNKVEVWFAPRFLIEREIGTRAGHFREILTDAKWPHAAEIGIFYTWGGWDNLNWYDYLTTNTIDQLGYNNLYNKWTRTCSPTATPNTYGFHGPTPLRAFRVIFELNRV